MRRILSQEEFVACVLADQAARRAAREDCEAAGEISTESQRMLNDIEQRMGMDYEAMCYEAEKRRRMSAKSIKRKQRKARRGRR